MAGIVLLRPDYGGNRRPPMRPPRNHMLAMTFALAAIGMFFIGLTSAYVVRQGLGEDWKWIPMPRILLANTAALLLSSLTLEKARLAVRGGDRRSGTAWLGTTLGLGVVFLGGQLAAWRMLALQGFYLSTNPHSTFFYLFTGLHGLHLAGGLLGLGWSVRLMLGASPLAYRGLGGTPATRAGRWVEATALYWHSMDALWVFLMVLLFVWG